MEEETWRDKLNKKLRIRNLLVRQGLAEFLGTFVLVAIGNGSVAQSTLSSGEYGPFSSVNWGYGIAVAMGVWVSGGVSGGHINPAVTLALTLIGKTRWIQVPVYMLAQYLGAFAASACLYGVYYESMEEFNGAVHIVPPDLNATAGIWATYPQDYLSSGAAFGDQTFSTFLLMLLILAITDDNNMKPPKGMVPFCVGLIVVALGMAFGYQSGYALNPARDLAPRLFTLMAGWGTETFTAFDYYFWIPVIGPHVGAVAGAFTYELFVGVHLEGAGDEDVHSDTSHRVHASGIPLEVLPGADLPASSGSRTNQGFEEKP